MLLPRKKEEIGPPQIRSFKKKIGSVYLVFHHHYAHKTPESSFISMRYKEWVDLHRIVFSRPDCELYSAKRLFSGKIQTLFKIISIYGSDL